MRVCVIGAGFSGLVAADELSRAGHDVIVLEARDRVGGRVWSQRLDDGCWVERGAEFIEQDQYAVRNLAADLGVELAPTAMSYSAREPRGGLPATLEECVEGANELVRVVASGEHGSVREALNATQIDEGVRAAIAARIQVSFAQPVELLDADVLVGHHAASFEGKEALRCAEGNQEIAHALARRLGDRVHLNSAVRHITWSDDHVQLRTEGGSTVDADAAVVTVPASVWRKIQFEPALPQWKADALDRVSYAHAAKLAVPLPTPAPPSATLSVPDFYWTWTATRGGANPDPVLNCFTGSEQALEDLGVNDGPDTWLQRVAELHPELALRGGSALLSTWDNDPWIEAAYSTRTRETRKDVDALQRPVGAMHFAGEHTAAENFALMEGAIGSGQRAAKELA